MKIVSEILSEMIFLFNSQGIENPRRQAEDFLCDLLGCSRASLYQDKNHILSETQFLKWNEWMGKRLKGEPLAYLHGEVQFYDCSLVVNSSVLIPRHETEILVDKIAMQLKNEDRQGKIFWDLCCGSGCIGIALKKKFPELVVTLSDKSEEALAVAERNAIRNGIELSFVKGDLLGPFYGKKAHYIACNPPYISDGEYALLDAEVKNFEPAEALVAGPTGLEFYQRLSKELRRYLFPHAKVWFEIGYQQGDQVNALFKEDFWKKRKMEKDWAGHDRFFFLENE